MAEHCTLEIPLLGPMVLRVPYSEAFVAALKRDLPVQAREWDEDRGAWLVYDHRPAVERVVLRHFATLHVYDRGAREDYVVDRAGRAAQARLL